MTMPEESTTPPAESANRRWRRLTPLLLLLVGFGAGALASHLVTPRRMHRREAAERRLDHRDGPGRDGPGRDGPSARRAGDRERSRGRDTRDGEARSRRFRQQLVNRLQLDEAQQEQMDAFIEANRAEASAFWEDTYARYGELRLKFRGQISEILSESQRETFEAWMSERGERGRNDRDGESVGGGHRDDSREGARR
jgi:hypothetical protein